MVISLFKRGDPSFPCNYRPISLLPILSKVFEKILSSQIRSFIEDHKLIHNRQFGFRPGCSTDQLVFQLIAKLKLMTSQKSSKFISAAALDIKKAFDCVNHKLLLKKCNLLFNFDTSASLLLQDYLNNRHQLLKYDNTFSSLKNISTGVPQGSILGPLLFVLFINDLMTLSSNCYLFADDCIVISHGSDSLLAAKNLEASLSSYANWYEENLLILNAEKTNIITFSTAKSKLSDLPKINFQNIHIKQTDNIKYLGFYLDSKLKMKKHLSLSKKKIYPVIQNFNRNRKFITANISSIWYKQLIRPLLEYCAPAIFCSNKYIIKDILAIENRCIKIISSHSKTLTRYQHDIPLINYRLKYLFLVAFFKLTHKIVPIIDELLLPKRASSSVTRLGATGGFLLGAGTGQVMAQGVVQYNDLPQQIRSLSCLKLFKASLKAHLFTLELPSSLI